MKSITNLTRYLRFINPFILSFTKPELDDYSNILIISGSPRSGTTWLGELLSTIPNSIMLFEPLHLKRNPRSKEYGFKWRTYISPESKNRMEKLFFEELFKCKHLNSWITREAPVHKLFNVEYLIFKFVRANLLLNWLKNNFPIKKPILIIRHPCAVVSSQLRLKQFSKLKDLYVSDKFYEDFPTLLNTLKNYGTYEELLSARWCQENYAPLATNKSSFLLITYENLLINPREEIKKIFNAWDIEIPDIIYEKFSDSSSTTHRNINHQNKTEVLGTWRKVLKDDQRKNILKVVRDFGMDFYTEDLEPDYERLYGDKPIRL